ncbi:TetR/AcrR family transcriptional regulator [Oerskovia turbata]|uniref:TetR/AcrR family transcriptional regulator n=1 Tax=Oerskovia turbata TaxID=1713 RepID=A0A4Q1KWG8_9CELL|nr:TetR/AcrR family transcriptional regulator [Oerskovia turbata]RXR23741.1 TetR/AcrR family transcriptional regulator [Oerskovia turbata]RXR33789.1 TetR/AcrR family transcriptional regulator [Oerskovia turbata]TGJ96801.1 TetR/AcrR family transcriptional regulator [Actinotalea fermentans ATCC 43279 = JCM 9966 = DSM 3133]
MSRDDRRAAIATATVPLLARYGAAVTTRQIAEAANVAEGTLFRAFEDKDELLHAALVAALDPAPLVRAIHDLPGHDSLETTLVALADLVQQSQRATARIVQVAHQFMGDRHGPHRRHGEQDADSHRDARMSAVQDIVGAIEARIAPHAPELRTEPRVAASVFFFLVHGHASPMMSQDGPLDPSQIVDVFLHGVLDDQCQSTGPPAAPVPTASPA